MHPDLCDELCEHSTVIAAQCEMQTRDPLTDFRDRVTVLVMNAWRRKMPKRD